MKSIRHKKILEIISEKVVTTQEQLQELLKEDGFVTTQATISRDIKELRLIKALSSTGDYYYTVPQKNVNLSITSGISSVFLDSIRSVDFAGNIAVLKCFSGMAKALCTSIDNGHWSGLMGTIAGDDTIFIVFKAEHNAEEFTRYLSDIVNEAIK